MNNIDLESYQKNMIKNVENTDIDSKIDTYINNYHIKTSLVNIDSRYRNKIPNNIVEMNSGILPSNPITTIKDSKLITVNIPNHNFAIGDKIILQNTMGKQTILNDSIYLLNNFDYYIVHINNHTIVPLYTQYNNYNLKISAYEKLIKEDRLIGNIPINSILGIHTIYLYDSTDINSFITTAIYNILIKELNVTKNELEQNYLFIKLPFKYTNTTTSNNNTIYNIKKIFQYDFTDIGGVILPYINANYPINYLQYQPYHEITSIGVNEIMFNSSVNALFSEQSGGDKIIVGKMINTIEGYPNANEYTLQLKKTFTDVVRMELVTSEIPYVDFNIKNNINTQNNKLYWKYLDDGDHIYTISIPEGSYTPSSLIDVLKTYMNRIPRIISTIKETIYNLFDIIFNENSQEVEFIAYKFQNLPNSFTITMDETLGNDIVILNIKQSNNFINIGDTIIISGATKIGDIASSLINGTQIVYSINKDTDTFTCLITLTQLYENINLTGTGGPNIKIKTPTFVSFLFNYNDTIGDIIGFKNVGEENAITPFSHIVSNFNNYIQLTPFDIVGNSKTTNSLLNLSGSYYYMLLYVNDIEGIQTNSNLENPFSKILMIGNSGDIMFNTFINSPLEFDIPLSSINDISIKFVFPDGTKPDFRNFDHSFTFRITERISKPVNTGLNSRKSNFTETLIDMHSK
jgi:hypothetical protein